MFEEGGRGERGPWRKEDMKCQKSARSGEEVGFPRFFDSKA